MRIDEFTAYRVRIPLKRKFRHASHTRTYTDSIVVRCRLESGEMGWGEGLPREYVTGESINNAWAMLADPDWTQSLAGELSNLAGAIERCRELRPQRPATDPRECFGNSVRCAVELAVLDACCRAEGVPLSKVTELYSPARPVYEPHERIRYSMVIGSAKAYKQVGQALFARLTRFHQAKVKTGLDDDADVASLRRLRRCLGNRFDIRIDANEAWDTVTLPQRLEMLGRWRISSVEQPVPHSQVQELAAVRKLISIPIMLDESLCSMVDAERAYEHHLCDLFNIRLSKCGGFLPSLDLAAYAHAHGLGYQLGCQVGETGILSAAGRHFGCSVGFTRYLEGSFDRLLVRERLTREDLTFGYGGWANALAGPGLGVEVDAKGVARVTNSEVHWKMR